ncbi:MAG: PpiC-type peptidyl-prolyl cis-trans isomerase [uncultured bacterium]|nr:MAG: PpiC-type peptidyl-prolyl cis-trans isomerase [uncultured bacterium]
MVKKQESFNYEIKFSKRLLIVVLVLILILALVYFSRRYLIAATVNDKSISRLAVLNKLEKQGGKKILETMITQVLIQQEAKKRKIIVNQKDIDGEMKKIEANVSSQGSTLDQALQTQGMTKNDLTEEIKIQLMLQKMSGNDIKISDKEIDDFINANKNQQGFDKEIPKEQVATQLKQQKLQQKMQSFITDLKAKAKINYFVSY